MAERINVTNERCFQFFETLKAGTYFIDYTDSTHLEKDQWVQLLQISTTNPPQTSFSSVPLRTAFFSGSVQVATLSSLPDFENRTKVIFDQLAQTLLRSGCLQPIASMQILKDIEALRQHESLVIIPDTNALSSGTLHWLSQVFDDKQLTLLPVAISLVQIQEHDRDLKSLLNAKKLNNLKSALRSRSLSTCSLSFLESFNERYQILEVAPELLRYVRPSSGRRGEQDQTDVLEDRLFVEAIHQAFRSARSRTPKRVVTSDITFARILHTEAIPTICLQVPIIENDIVFDNFRFDPLAKRFIGTTLPHLIGNLAEVFSTIRVRTEKNQEVVFKTELYWPGKSVNDWTGSFTKAYLSTANVQVADAVQELPSSVDFSETDPALAQFSSLAVPNISVLPVLSFAQGLTQPVKNLQEAIDRMPKVSALSQSAAQNAGEVLLQAGFISVGSNGEIRPTTKLNLLLTNLVNHNLDGISELFQSLEFYSKTLLFLKATGALPEDLPEDLKSSVERTSIFAYKSLKSFLLYLGQAWTDEGRLLDGSVRPPDTDFTRAFVEIFGDAQSMPLSELTLSLAHKLKVAPWAVLSYIERLAPTELSALFRFEPASGAKSKTRDKVLQGSGETLRLEPVVIDRISIANRPVFTVTRRS